MAPPAPGCPVKGLFCPDGLGTKTWRSVLCDDSDADDEVIGGEWQEVDHMDNYAHIHHVICSYLWPIYCTILIQMELFPAHNALLCVLQQDHCCKKCNQRHPAEESSAKASECAFYEIRMYVKMFMHMAQTVATKCICLCHTQKYVIVAHTMMAHNCAPWCRQYNTRRCKPRHLWAGPASPWSAAFWEPVLVMSPLVCRTCPSPTKSTLILSLSPTFAHQGNMWLMIWCTEVSWTLHFWGPSFLGDVELTKLVSEFLFGHLLAKVNR